MQEPRLRSALVALLVLAAGCTGGVEEEPPQAVRPLAQPDALVIDPPGRGEPVDGGTVVFGADQEPEVLNPLVTAGNLTATSYPMAAVLRGAYRTTPQFEYVPDLIVGEAEVTTAPFTVTYEIRRDATWSDGTPITAHDFVFTYETIVDPSFAITSRDGYDLITSAQALDDKTAAFTFSETFAPYRTLFDWVLPRHALEGEDFDTVWNDSVDIASGPFMVESWTKGQDLTLVRNDSWWGETPALDSIVVRFLQDADAQVQALRAGEVDVIYPQPQVELVEQLDDIAGVVTDVSAGTQWEHLDFNFAVPPLDRQYVRQAIFQAIDREALAEQLVRPMHREAEPIDNVIYVNNQPEYEPHFDRYPYDPAAAARLLEDNGCTKGEDGIYTCDGHRLSFRYTTTAGNPLRELQLEMIRAQLQQLGIEIIPATGPASDVFTNILPAGPRKAWDLFNFAWVSSPDPFPGNSIWQCGGDQNYTGYCDEQVTQLLESTNTIVDARERAAVYNRADALMAEDIPVVPLYQKPTLLAWRSTLRGPEDNPTQEGPLWNAQEWTLTE